MDERNDPKPPVSLFREESQRRRVASLHGVVIVQSDLSWRLVLASAAIALSAVVVILGVATFPTTATASGHIAAEGGVVHVVAHRAGVVERVLLENGDRVQQGQAIAAIAMGETSLSGTRQSVLINESVSRQVGQVSAQISAVNARQRAEAQTNQARISAIREQISSLSAREPRLEGLVELAQTDFDRARSIASRGFLSRSDLADRQETLFRLQENLAALQGELRVARAQLVQAQAESSAAVAANEQELSALRGSLEEVERLGSLTDLDQGYLLTATSAGRINNLSLNVGDYVSAGAPILTIQADGSEMTVELHLEDQLATTIRVGQEVRISLSAFPASRYGYIRGVISETPSTPEPGGSSEEAPAAYIATATVDGDSIPQSLADVRLIDGMSLEAFVELERPSLIGRLLRPRLWFSD